jgi:hypothetical protein
MTPDPYVGPRPFERDDLEIFFGRVAEIRMLTSLVLASRVVLLYALSGAGKTSLLNAGLVPALEEDQYFEVLPTARVRGIADARDANDGGNPFVDGVLSYWSADGASATSLPEMLARLPHSDGPDGFRRPRLVIIDQFEELFTVHPDRWRDRGAVFEELAQALGDDPLLRVILALREDYLAQLEPYRDLLPERLENRFRLELLGSEAAREAVTGPLATTGRQFAAGVAERIVADLRTTSIAQDGDGWEFESEYVEPVQLQLTCSALWRDLPSDVTKIGEEHVRTFGNVDQVLTDFYDEAIAAAAATASVDADRLRREFASTFITAVNTRGTAYLHGKLVGSVPAAAVEELERRRLVRTEWRANARWYELTHDRLIGPIKRSNELRLVRSVTDLGLAVRGAVGALIGAVIGAVPASSLSRSLVHRAPLDRDDLTTIRDFLFQKGILWSLTLAAAAAGAAIAARSPAPGRRILAAFVLGGLSAMVATGIEAWVFLVLDGTSRSGVTSALVILGALVGYLGLVGTKGWFAMAGGIVGGLVAGQIVGGPGFGSSAAAFDVLPVVLLVAGVWTPALLRATTDPSGERQHAARETAAAAAAPAQRLRT